MRSSYGAMTAGCVLLWSFCGAADRSHAEEDALPGTRVFHALKVLPMTPESYRPEVAELIGQGVPERFGNEEWAAVVLTNELHQHVGMYSIIGAKMGVRARELLLAPPRAIRVTMETGSRPPLACVIDGIQVALGSTLAQDLIHVPATAAPSVAAVFEYKGRAVRLSLKAGYVQKIRTVIQDAIVAHGDLTPAYFKAVERRSYPIWAEFDRKEIFDVEESPPPEESVQK